jgi:hypothetical protein
MQGSDPDLIAKNECVGALFAGLTGCDPYLNDNVRSAIDFSITGQDGSPAPMDAFLHRAEELSRKKGQGFGSFCMCHINLRERFYEPLWINIELVAGLKRMAGSRRSLLVVSGLRDALRRSLPRRRRRIGEPAAMAEARHFIDSLGARYSTSECRMSILYLD